MKTLQQIIELSSNEYATCLMRAIAANNKEGERVSISENVTFNIDFCLKNPELSASWGLFA